MNRAAQLEAALAAVRLAARAVAAVGDPASFGSSGTVTKGAAGPATVADLASQAAIVASLRASLGTGIRVMAEESADEVAAHGGERLLAVVARSLSKSVTDSNVGVIFKPQRNVSLFAGYNKVGGALPTSILAGETAANFIIQTGDQLEAGVKTTLLNGRVTTSFSWFDIAQSNFQVPNSAFNIDPRQPQFLFQDLTSTGYEFEFTALLHQQLLLVGNFIHLRMRDPNGVRQRMVPDNAAALFLKYEVAGVKGLALTLGLDYMDSAPGEQASGITAASTATKVIPNQPSFYVAPRTIANLGVSYRRDQWTTRVSIDNALDKDYIQSAGSRNTLVAGLPRTWAVSLAYKF